MSLLAMELKPFLSWAGSKRKLLKHLEPFLPPKVNKYFEPFLGGASLFLFLRPNRAEISDISTELIATYRAVRDNPSEILKVLRPLKPTRENFEITKRDAPATAAEKAARFIFLNKTCWNGLYRVNAAGVFNVPFGRPKSDFVVDEPNLLGCSNLLRKRGISIKCQDFEKISERVVEGDFVFLDPPYVTSHNLNGFVDWNEELFSWGDQIRLATMARKLVANGANVLITNADHDDIRALYRGFGSAVFYRSSTLASDKHKRRSTSEAIFFAGPAYEPFKKQVHGRRGDRSWLRMSSS